MNVLLVLNSGVRVVVRLKPKSLQKKLTDLIDQGNQREAAELLRTKAEVQNPLPHGVPLSPEHESLLKVVE